MEMLPNYLRKVSLICNNNTGYILPQYHIVFDYKFLMVPNAESGGLIETRAFDPIDWQQIVASSLKQFIQDRDTDPGPRLQDDWLTEPEIDADRRF